jgi:cell division protein FtsI (penicillin-binding protein 3)
MTTAWRSGPRPLRRPGPAVGADALAGGPGLRGRCVAVLAAILCVLAAIAGRLVVIQGVAPERYVALGAAQRTRTLVIPAPRGTIFDRNGRELALSVPQTTVWADPRQVTDPAGEARALAGVLGVDEDVLRERLTRAAAFVYLARAVPDDVATRVRALRLDGVHFTEEPKRFLPAGALAAPVIGLVGVDHEGLSGLELQYEDRLAGQPGELSTERDVTGTVEIPAAQREFRPARPGEDLVLTIDRALQYETERALAAEIQRSNALGGIAVVMDPRTGEILAMANLRADKATGTVVPSAANDAVVRVYEPGSVNKVITIAGALEEGLVRPATVLTVPWALPVADHVFHDHDPHPPERWSVTDILANSSNIGTIMIGQRLGRDRIDRYLRAFGLGSVTGLGFPGESAGLLLDPKRWSGTSIGTVPIGQGLAVTALQMLVAYNTIANGGVRVAPRLVKATIDGAGRRVPAPRPPATRVVSERTARQLTAMLTEVVRAGTGTAAAIDGYVVAGKTGTARKPLEGARGYKPGAYVATFAGFVPAQDPRLSAIVVLDEPTPIYGGLTAAPVFAQVAKYALRLLRIPPGSGPVTAGGVPRVGGGEQVRPDGELDGAPAGSARTTDGPVPARSAGGRPGA